MSNTIYANTLVVATVDIALGGGDSTILNCVNTSKGMSCPRRLSFPSGWTTADVSFKVSETANFAVSYDLWIWDGNDNIKAIIPACVQNASVNLVPFWFDSIQYLKIVSNTPQAAARTVSVIMQPIYQGGT